MREHLVLVHRKTGKHASRADKDTIALQLRALQSRGGIAEILIPDDKQELLKLYELNSRYEVRKKRMRQAGERANCRRAVQINPMVVALAEEFIATHGEQRGNSPIVRELSKWVSAEQTKQHSKVHQIISCYDPTLASTQRAPSWWEKNIALRKRAKTAS